MDQISDDHPAGASTAAAQDPQAVLAGIAAENADGLVDLFYGTFMQDAEGSAFLSHAIVQERLKPGLRRWLLELLASDPDGDRASFEAHQRAIGAIHARVRLPAHLVMKGTMFLKSVLAAHLVASPLDRDGLAAALGLLNSRIDDAMCLMGEAYVSVSAKGAEVDEAFRLFAIGQDSTVDRESQRAALMEWSQSILFSLLGNGASGALPPIGSSPFGLWVHHRAGLMFQGSPSLETINANLQNIDRVLLPKIAEAREAGGPPLSALTSRLQTMVDEIKFLLGELFQSVAGLESGRDPLTRTLNRRFLPSILGRETAIAIKGGAPFTLLMLDVDHFKRINDGAGHSVGDLVLRQVADVILDTVRLSDFVFRYGGEEFLIALIETNAAEGMEIAERIRQSLERKTLNLPDGSDWRVTVSIGAAAFDGHPDYTHLIDLADKALYAAKQQGRNRTVTAQAIALS